MTETRRYPQVSFRPGPLLSDLMARTKGDDAGGLISEVARRDLSRYYDLLRRDLPAMNEKEALLMIDALNGTYLETGTIHLLPISVQEAGETTPDIEERWGVSAGAVAVGLRKLSRGELLAVWDAIERYWQTEGTPSERLRAVGLVRGD